MNGPAGNWQQHAACKGVNPTLFHPDEHDHTSIHQAVTVCAGCPVRDECLTHAIDNDELFGIWGGLTEQERAGHRKPRQQTQHVHGTRHGYQRHMRQGQPACEPCLAANRDYTTRARARKVQKRREQQAAA